MVSSNFRFPTQYRTRYTQIIIIIIIIIIIYNSQNALTKLKKRLKVSYNCLVSHELSLAARILINLLRASMTIYHLRLSTVPSRQVIESIPDYRAAELEDSQDNDVDGSGGYRSNIKMFIRPYKREVEPLIYTIENERNARYEQLEREAAIV